jgi:hypothetical protein
MFNRLVLPLAAGALLAACTSETPAPAPSSPPAAATPAGTMAKFSLGEVA